MKFTKKDIEHAIDNYENAKLSPEASIKSGEKLVDILKWQLSYWDEVEFLTEDQITYIKQYIKENK